MTNQISRKVHLRFSADRDEIEVYSGELNALTLEYVKVALVNSISDPSDLVDQVVIIEEESVQETTKRYESTVIGFEESVVGETKFCTLILRRPSPLQERRFPRVEVNFPATVKIESDQPDSQTPFYEALASNLSVSGLLVILGLPDIKELNRGQVVGIRFELQFEEALVFTLNAQVVRKQPIDFGGASNKYMVAFNFIDISPEIESQISHYVFSHQVGSDSLQTSDENANQTPALKSEIYRLQEQLRAAHLRIKEAEESRIRSETIIVQLTRKLNEQGTIINRRNWWKFWDPDDDN